MASTRLPSFANVGTDLVTVVVGSEKHKHVVYKALLTQVSPYFKAMFSGLWKEASMKEPLPLPLATNQDFISFLDWLYFRRMPCPLERDVGSKTICCNCGGPCAGQLENSTVSFDIAALSLEDEGKVEALIETDSLDELTGLYIFANQFDVPLLREQLVNQEWPKCVSNEGGGMVGYADVAPRFRSLPASSPFCRLQIDEYMQRWSPVVVNECPIEPKIRSKLPCEFTFVLAAKLAETTMQPWLRGVSALRTTMNILKTKSRDLPA